MPVKVGYWRGSWLREAGGSSIEGARRECGGHQPRQISSTEQRAVVDLLRMGGMVPEEIDEHLLGLLQQWVVLQAREIAPQVPFWPGPSFAGYARVRDR